MQLNFNSYFFQTSEDLETHLNTEEHKLETEKHRILQINFSPPPLPENTSSRKRPLKSGSGEPQSKLPRTYPPPLDGFYGKEDPETGILLRPEDLEDVCSTCNLLFLSKKHLKAHLKSRNHLLGKILKNLFVVIEFFKYCSIIIWSVR